MRSVFGYVVGKVETLEVLEQFPKVKNRFSDKKRRSKIKT